MAVHLVGTSRRSGRRRMAPIAEINVTPFVDVMLVLLIVFMIAAPLLTVGVPLQLPNAPARALPADLQEPLTISIDASGTVYVQQTEIAADELVAKLTAIAGERPPGRVYVRADAELPYGRAAEVLGALNVSGYRDVGLVMNTDSSPAEAEPAPGGGEATGEATGEASGEASGAP